MSSLGYSETHTPLIYLKVSRRGLKGSNTHSHGFTGSRYSVPKVTISCPYTPCREGSRSTSCTAGCRRPRAGPDSVDFGTVTTSRVLQCLATVPAPLPEPQRSSQGSQLFHPHLRESAMLLQSVSASFPRKGPGYVRLYGHAVSLLGGCSGGLHRRQTGKGRAWPRAKTTLLGTQAALAENSYLLCMLTRQ